MQRGPLSQPTEPPEEFWQEERRDERELIRRQLVRWAAIFAMLFAGVFFAFWWAGSAVQFGAARVEGSTGPTWRVYGEVRNAVSGAPVEWAQVEDDPGGRPPFHKTSADQNGAFELMTIAEPHNLRVTALGYKPATVHVGRVWYLWLPRGEERAVVALSPE
jgi:hypothetical protein